MLTDCPYQTLLYMLIQRAGSGTLPPPGFTAPPWSSLLDQWTRHTPSLSTPTTTLGPVTVILGHDDSEADDFLPESMHNVNGHEFGWDNESPARAVDVDKFKIDWRPISNAEFLAFQRGVGRGKVDIPKSWVDELGEIKVDCVAVYGGLQCSLFDRFERSTGLCRWKLLRIGPY
jgi:L-histidine Nalpha-methyltransferase / hercynylcysteine S-oxide synthase